MADRLNSQIDFIFEIDQLKQIFRQTFLPGDGRAENDAEHSWHLATMAVLLAEYAEGGVDLLKVVKMLLIHDLVEIDAGDTFAYDEAAHRDKAAREEKAATRIYGILPADQGAEYHRLWQEFEARQSPEARYAAALDRLQPVLLNLRNNGVGWRRHGIRRQQVIDYNRHMAEGSPRLWAWAEAQIEAAVAQGILPE